VGWVKLNIDGVAQGSPGLAACGGIFRGSCGEYIGGFTAFLGIHTTLYVEIIGVILTIEHAQFSFFSKLWLENDYSLLCQSFSSTVVVSWSLGNGWIMYMQFFSNIDFKVSHIFREGNHWTYKLA